MTPDVTPDVEQEELAAGAESRRPRWLWWLVGVVVLVVGSVLTGLTGVSSPEPAPAPSPTPAVTPAMYRPGPLTYLDVGETCQPITEGRRKLRVSFYLQNMGGVRVRVLDVTPLLPLAGLTVAGPVRSGGTCDAPGREPVRQTTLVGEKRLYTITFRLPAHMCPKPYPVQATYRIDVNGQQMTAELPLLPDLSVVDFPTC